MDNRSNHPHRSFEEQITILEKEKHIIIDDRELAMEALQSFSYYTIVNGYKDVFLTKKTSNNKKDTFEEKTTFSMLYQVHWMDLSLGNILFKYTIAVEKKLKTQIAYLCGEKFGILEKDYLDEENYSNQRYHKGRYRNFINASKNKATNSDISLKHYKASENNIPPWIMSKAISFGSAVNWYTCFKFDHKLSILSAFNFPSGELTTEEQLIFFNNCIQQVYKYRNLTAHGNRTLAFKVPHEHKLLVKHLEYVQYDSFFKKNARLENLGDIFSIMMCIMILINDRYVLLNFLKELDNFFLFYKDPVYTFNGKNIFELYEIPEDSLSRLSRFFEMKFTS